MNTFYFTLLLISLWIIKSVKGIFLFLYLWQLKEYHFKRFIDHFRTANGRKLFLNYLFFSKVLIAAGFIPLLLATRFLGRTSFLTAVSIALILIYLFEAVVFFKNIFKKTFKKPVFTKKALFLTFVSFLFASLYLLTAVGKTREIFLFVFLLLVFDILTLLIVSFAVLIIQPFVVLYRNHFILNKAKEKISRRKDLKIIGITGSYGKTTVKEFLSTILSFKFNVLKTEKHQNSEMGISKRILNDLNPEHEIFIVEMGAYGIGGIKLLADIAQPQIGILTGINQQHLSLFGSQANIIKTKYELIENLPKTGLAIFNGDNKYCLELFRTTNIPKKLYRTSNISKEIVFQPDIWAENVKIEKDCIFFKAATKEKESADIKANVLGKQNISNMLAAILAAKNLGMSLEEIREACLNIVPEQGSIVSAIGKKDINILNATYSSNPDGVLADLDFLNIWPGRKIIIMPCLIELGEYSKEAHKKIGEKIASICDLAIITTKERYQDIEESAVSKGMKSENIILIDNPEKILIQLDIFSRSGDTILLEGRVPKKIINELSKR